MATVEKILAKVRLELGDEARPFIKTDVGDGVTTSFATDHYPLKSDLVVKVNNIATTLYTVDLSTGTVTFTTAPVAGAAIAFMGNSFKYFTDDSLSQFVDTALTQQLNGRKNMFGSSVNVSTMPDVEEQPAVILATIEALWALATDAAFDIDIHTPEGVSIPRAQRFNQLMMLIDSKKEYYRTISELLGVGLYGVEVYNLRRVAMKTGRLVPAYIPREVEDSTPPIRIRVAGSAYGGAIPVEQNAIFDIYTVQDTTWQSSFDFPYDLTDLVLTAQIRLFPGSPVVLADITCTITDVNNGIALLSLTRAQTQALPERGIWDLKAVGISDPTWSDVLMKGKVFVERKITV